MQFYLIGQGENMRSVELRPVAAMLAICGAFACGDLWKGLTRNNERNCVANPGLCVSPLICNQSTGDCADPTCGPSGCPDLAGVQGPPSDGSTGSDGSTPADGGTGLPPDMTVSPPLQVWATNASGEIWQRTGTTWTMSKATGGSLKSIWGSSATDILAVGGSAAWHWDGASWTTVSTGGTSMRAICGSGTTDAWVTQDSTRAVLHRDSGGAWSTITPPTGAFYACWGTTGGKVFPAGQSGEFMRCTGSSCIQETSRPSMVDINGVWGTSSTDLWVVGLEPMIHHSVAVNTWIGYSTSGSKFRAVWGSGANDIWAVGDSALCAHYTGVSWGSCPAGLSGNLAGISGRSSSDIWIVGSSGTVFHWNGASFVQESAGGADMRAVWVTP